MPPSDPVERAIPRAEQPGGHAAVTRPQHNSRRPQDRSRPGEEPREESGEIVPAAKGNCR
jgi:hypothetical protein